MKNFIQYAQKRIKQWNLSVSLFQKSKTSKHQNHHRLHLCKPSSMASISADIATTFFSLASRRTKTLSRFQTSVHFRGKSQQCHSLSLRTSSWRSATQRRGFRRLSVAATATTPQQSEVSDVSTMIPPDNRIPATIITGFLGSGKVSPAYAVSICFFGMLGVEQKMKIWLLGNLLLAGAWHDWKSLSRI